MLSCFSFLVLPVCTYSHVWCVETTVFENTARISFWLVIFIDVNLVGQVPESTLQRYASWLQRENIDSCIEWKGECIHTVYVPYSTCVSPKGLCPLAILRL